MVAELTLSDLAVAKATGAPVPAAVSAISLLSPSAPQIKIARLYISGEMQSLLGPAPVANAIDVDGVRLSRTHLGQGRYDVDDIFERLTPANG